MGGPGADHEHQWEYDCIVLDVLPDGITFRRCQCGARQSQGPRLEDRWSDIPDAPRPDSKVA